MSAAPDIIECSGDTWLSARLAMREMGIRQGSVIPTTDDERRQREEGAREWKDLDCVRMTT